jgi:acyl-CoA synthetase (AMP-forming)/AMP-acid ligase II
MARPSQTILLALGRATLGTIWQRLADTYGDRTAFTLEEPARLGGRSTRHLTYEDIATRVERIASGLTLAGARRGGRVAVCTSNRLDYALITFAAVRAGCVAIPLHHHLKRPEVASLVKRSRADMLVCDEGVALETKGVQTLVVGASLEQAIASAATTEPHSRVTSKDPAVILFTSGTTGAPKGATLTSRSLLAVARLAAVAPKPMQSELGLCGLPLAHVMGMSTLLCTAMAGAPLHWISKFDAKVVLERLEHLHATFFIGVPAMYAMLAEQRPERRDLSSVRLFASGADAMPPPLVERFRKLGCAQKGLNDEPLFTAAFAEIYGMVELSGPAIVKVTLPQPVEGTRSGRVTKALGRLRDRLRGTTEESPSVGIPIPPYRARVVDANGKSMKAGDVGELVLKGPGVTKGYDADAEATAKTTRDGWLFTGDLARRNRLGLIAFVTRKKDVIKHGGFSVFPAEVEAQLLEHPAIAEAIVFGIPHATKGALPAAAIVLKHGAHASEQQLLDWSREHIAPFKAPRALALVASSDVPRNANKKVLKDELRSAVLPKLVGAH